MNKSAMTKHEIYNKLAGLSAKDLDSIANFVDFMRHQKKVKPKKVIKLQGILKGHAIDLAGLKQYKKQTWQHVVNGNEKCTTFGKIKMYHRPG